MRIPWALVIALLLWAESSSAVYVLRISWKDGDQLGTIALDSSGTIGFDTGGANVVPGMNQLRSAIEGYCYITERFEEVTEEGRVYALRLPVTPGYYGTSECGYYFTEENILIRGYEATRNSFAYRNVDGVIFCHIDKADSVKVVGCQHPYFANYGYSALDLRFCNPSSWTAYEKGMDKDANCPFFSLEPIEIETFFNRVGYNALPTQTDEKFVLALGDVSLFLLPNDEDNVVQYMYHGRTSCTGAEQWGYKKPSAVKVTLKYMVNGLNAVCFNDLQGCADTTGNLLSGWRQKCSITLQPTSVQFIAPLAGDPFITVCSNDNPIGWRAEEGVNVTKLGFTLKTAAIKKGSSTPEYMTIRYEPGHGFTIGGLVPDWRTNILDLLDGPVGITDWLIRLENMSNAMAFNAYATESEESFYRVTTEARFMGSQYAFIDYALDFDEGATFGEVAGITDASAIQGLSAIAVDAGAKWDQSFLVIENHFNKPAEVVGPIMLIWAAKLIAEALRSSIGPYGTGLMIEPAASGAGTSLVPVAQLASDSQSSPELLEEVQKVTEQLQSMPQLEIQTDMLTELQTQTERLTDLQTLDEAMHQIQQSIDWTTGEQTTIAHQDALNTQTLQQAQLSALEQLSLNPGDDLSPITSPLGEIQSSLERQEQRELTAPSAEWELSLSNPLDDLTTFTGDLEAGGPDAGEVSRLASSIASSGGGGWAFPVPLPAATLGVKSDTPWALAEYSIRPSDEWDWVLNIIRNIAGVFISVGFGWRVFLLLTYLATQGGEGSKGS